jgi:predicted methyltransferase
MTKKEYLAKRKILLDEAQGFVDAGKMEDYEAKAAEVVALDDEFEKLMTAQANISALSGQAKSVNPVIGNNVVASVNFNNAQEEDVYASKAYRVAFANLLPGEKQSHQSF